MEVKGKQMATITGTSGRDILRGTSLEEAHHTAHELQDAITASIRESTAASRSARSSTFMGNTVITIV